MLRMILLVEDDGPSLRAMTLALRTANYDVATASNGTEALALLAESRFEAIITDLVMPNMNGLDLINLIRRQWPDMGVILMSGYIADNAGKAVVGGKEAFLLKPVSPTDLITTVERVLSKRNVSTPS